MGERRSDRGITYEYRKLGKEGEAMGRGRIWEDVYRGEGSPGSFQGSRSTYTETTRPVRCRITKKTSF